jgi:hypothetical protein
MKVAVDRMSSSPSHGGGVVHRKATVRRGCLLLALMALATSVQQQHTWPAQVGSVIYELFESSILNPFASKKKEALALQQIQDAFGCQNMQWSDCVESIALAQRQESDFLDNLQSLRNLTRLMGCEEGGNGADCLSHALHIAEYRRAQNSTLKRHIKEALHRAAQPSPLPEYAQISYYTNNHPALIPLNPTYRPDPAWSQTNMADLNIVGFPKAGTSQLFKLLTSHNRTTRLHPNIKEFCLPQSRLGGRGQGATTSAMPLFHREWTEPAYGQLKPSFAQKNVQATLRNFHRDAYQNVFRNRKDLTNDTVTVNACLQWRDLEFNWFYLGKPRNKKFILILRDPVDWAWAAWNFWTHDSLDKPSLESEADNRTDLPPSRWTVVGEHYRSPELFHEMVASGLTTWNGARIVRQRQTTIMWIKKLIGMVGRENVLLLRNEDMMPDRVAQPGGLLDQVSAFTGLDRSLFPEHVYNRITNCNNRKGTFSQCDRKSSAYEIAGYRDMLPETRPLLYLQYWEECKMWSRDYGVDYPDCLNIMKHPSVAPIVAQMVG